MLNLILIFSFNHSITKKWFKKNIKNTIEKTNIVKIIKIKINFVKLYIFNKKIILIFNKNIIVGGKEIMFNETKKNNILKFNILKKFLLLLFIKLFKKKKLK